MTEFYLTGMGKKFFESTLPRLATALERLADHFAPIAREKPETQTVGPYNYFNFRVTDVANALTFLNEQWERGYEYVSGLPDFRQGAHQEATVCVLFIERKR